MRQDTAGYGRIWQIRHDPTVYALVQQDTTRYSTIQNICSFALRIQPFCVQWGFGGISYCSCVPIQTFMFRLTTRFAAQQFWALKKKEIATCLRRMDFLRLQTQDS